jgi:hypothetical protein
MRSWGVVGRGWYRNAKYRATAEALILPSDRSAATRPRISEANNSRRPEVATYSGRIPNRFPNEMRPARSYIDERERGISPDRGPCRGAALLVEVDEDLKIAGADVRRGTPLSAIMTRYSPGRQSLRSPISARPASPTMPAGVACPRESGPRLTSTTR